jgi:hypothetical protein
MVLSYSASFALGLFALGFFFMQRRGVTGKWPDLTDGLLVLGSVFALIQGPVTAISLIVSVGPDLSLDGFFLIVFGLVSTYGLAIQELYKKFKYEPKNENDESKPRP